MSQENEIVLIYGQKQSIQSAKEVFFIARAIDIDAKLHHSVLKNKFKELYGFECEAELGQAGPFDSKDEIHRFLYSICEEIGAKRGHIVHTSEYNHYLEESNESQELWANLLKHGHSIDNIEATSKKRGIWEKFFN